VLSPGSAAVFDQHGDLLSVSSGDKTGRFILLSGKPLNEPIYWYGPMVMNTREEIDEALSDLRRGTFIRDRNPVFQ
jgi:redox-sensitive bicupin YhaK (pirin superfamily)